MRTFKRWIQVLTPVTLGAICFLYFNATTPLNYEMHNSGNLVRNGNFERYSKTGIPANWTSYCNNPVKSVRDFGRRDKSSALLIDNRTDRACGLKSDTFPVEQNKYYRLEADATWESDKLPLIYVYFYKGTTRLNSKVYSILRGKRKWSRIATNVLAPPGADRAQVYLYSSTASTMKAYFDGIAFYEQTSLPQQIVFYAGPVATGSGKGGSQRNRARYNDVNFWKRVQGQLASRPVKVILKIGVYPIATSADKFILKGLGNPFHRLTIEGQSAYGTIFMFPKSATKDPGVLVTMERVTNTVLRHIHFRSQASVELGYLMNIVRSENITLAGLTAIDLPLVKFGVLGPHQGTKNIMIREVEMLRLGYDIHQHFIYAFRKIQNLHLKNSVLEDSTGAYFRCRDVCHDLKISDSEFYATGTWGNIDVFRFPHFFELAVFNDQLWDGKNRTQQEWFGKGVTAINNKFHYEKKAGNAIPFSIVHQGYKPWDGSKFRDHLLDSQDRDLLLNGHVTYRRNMINKKFGINVRSYFTVLNNSFSGELYLLELQSAASYDAKNYYAPAEYAGSGSYDISSCLIQ